MNDRSELHQKNLEKIFYPKSVAIVGTNNVKGTVPYDILYNILKADLNGIVFPVSPREKHISSVKAYKYVLDIEDPVDLAIIVFASSVTHMALEQCGQKGIKSVIIISAGFKEIGPAGLAKEKKLVEIAEKYDMSFIGPNCLGVINTDPLSNLDASFARKMPIEGSIAFLSQSGALCTAVLDYAQAKHIGFSKFVSFGNKADISEIDLLYYLMNDEKTKVILLYLEEVSDGPGLMKAARDVIEQSGKPILILKSGRTSEGASAAASHTGSLAGSDEICDAAFEQAGIIRTKHIEEMFNIAIAFAYQPIPDSEKVAIITNAGGPGVLTTDAAIKEGLKMAKFSEETTAILKKNLPATANIKNPVDVIGDARADRYDIAINASFNDDDVSGVFVILTPQSMTDIELIAEEIVKVSKDAKKPIYASFMGESDVATGIDILQKNNIPHYFLPESMSKSFAVVQNFHNNIKKDQPKFTPFDDIDHARARQILEKAQEEGKKYLTEKDAINVLDAYGLNIPKNGLVHSATEAADLADQIGYPVVMKVMSEDIVHKFDVKGVVLNINSHEEAEKAYQSIMDNVKQNVPDAVIDGIYVVEMIGDSDEVILGVKRDPSFGPVIMFGLGGIFVEIFKDVSFRVAPVTETEAQSMIEQIKSHAIISGARGKTPRDIAKLKESIMRLGQLAVEQPAILELDINPMMVKDEGKGCYVTDAKIML